MPQLDPYYFVNQVLYAFSVLIILTHVTSKYNLPNIIKSYVGRNFIKVS